MPRKIKKKKKRDAHTICQANIKAHQKIKKEIKKKEKV